MKIKDVVILELERFNESVKRTIKDKHMDASGDAYNSLAVVDRGNVISSVGNFYIEYLNRGRGPGGMPPLVAIIRWVKLKKSSKKMDPFAIARNIAKYGTKIYRDKDRSLGLQLEDKVKELEDNLNKDLPKFISDKLITALNKSFKKWA